MGSADGATEVGGSEVSFADGGATETTTSETVLVAERASVSSPDRKSLILVDCVLNFQMPTPSNEAKSANLYIFIILAVADAILLTAAANRVVVCLQFFSTILHFLFTLYCIYCFYNFVCALCVMLCVISCLVNYQQDNNVIEKLQLAV